MTTDKERLSVDDTVEVPLQYTAYVNKDGIRIDPFGTIGILPAIDVGVRYFNR